MARPTYDPDLLLVGIFGRPHGLKGEIILRTHNAHGGADLALVPALTLEYGAVKEERPLRSARRHPDGWLVRVEGIESREAAAALIHASVRIRKDALPPMGPDEFFVEDLVGCEVFDETGANVGVVDGVFWNGAHDVMSVLRTSDQGSEEQLIPLVPTFLREVDARSRRIVVAVIESSSE